MLIDYTYFIGKINLPQRTTEDGQADLNLFIALYEQKYLQCVLGFDLWKAFTDGINVEDSGLIDERWLNLLDGVDYAYQGKNGHWAGFTPDFGSGLDYLKVSPIANYVYYQYMANRSSDTMGVGEVVSETDNNKTVNGMRKMITAWNDMVQMNVSLYRYLSANKTVYPEWKVCGSCSYAWVWSWPVYYNRCRRCSDFCDDIFKLKNILDI